MNEDKNNKNKNNNKTSTPKRGSGPQTKKPAGTFGSAKKAVVPPGPIPTTQGQSMAVIPSSHRPLSTEPSTSKACAAVSGPSGSSGIGGNRRGDAGSASAVGTKDNPLVSARAIEHDRRDPLKAGYTDRRKASRILRRLATDPIKEDQVSREDLKKIREDIEWAKKVLPDFKLEPPRSKLPATKRNRSVEETSTANPTAKRARTHGVGLKSFAEVAKDKVIVGVIDQNGEDGKIPRHQWSWIEASLAKVALQVLKDNPGPPPSCTDAGWFQGNVKLMACDDARSAELFKAAVEKVGEVYPGARLKAVNLDEIPSRPRARVRVPVTPSEPEEILEMLKLFNPAISTDNWKVVKLKPKTEDQKSGTKRSKMEILLLLNHECLSQIDQNDGTLNYGFAKILPRIYKTDTVSLAKRAACSATSGSQSDIELESGSEDELSSASELTAAMTGLCNEQDLLEDPLSDEEADVTVVGVPEDVPGTPN